LNNCIFVLIVAKKCQITFVFQISAGKKRIEKLEKARETLKSQLEQQESARDEEKRTLESKKLLSFSDIDNYRCTLVTSVSFPYCVTVLLFILFFLSFPCKF